MGEPGTREWWLVQVIERDRWIQSGPLLESDEMARAIYESLIDAGEAARVDKITVTVERVAEGRG